MPHFGTHTGGQLATTIRPVSYEDISAWGALDPQLSSSGRNKQDVADLQISKRRTIAMGAAWSLPVIAAAIAKPSVYANTITSSGSYFWKESATSAATTLNAAKSGLSADYSMQVGLNLLGIPLSFEPDCTLVITVFFNKPVTVSSPFSVPDFVSGPELSAPDSTFSFRFKAGTGTFLGFKITGSKPGIVVATSTMRVENGHPNLDWEPSPNISTTELVK